MWAELVFIGIEFVSDMVQLILLIWLTWRELGRIIEQKIDETVSEVTTERDA